MKKTIVAELRSSFYKNDKMYDDYLIGTIKFNNNEYLVKPAEDGDEVYTTEEKREILNRILDDTVMVSLEDGPKEITTDDPEFLIYHAYYYTNMYGGLYIIEGDKADDGTEEESDDEAEEMPDEDDEMEDEAPEPESTEKKLNVTKKKQMIPKQNTQ